MRKLTPTHDSLTLVGSLLFLLVAVAGHRPAHASTSTVIRNALTGQSPQESDVRELPPGVVAEGELVGDEKHHYRIVLAADQHVSFQIEKRGIILSLTLKDPAGVRRMRSHATSRQRRTPKFSVSRPAARPSTRPTSAGIGLFTSPLTACSTARTRNCPASSSRCTTKMDERRTDCCARTRYTTSS